MEKKYLIFFSPKQLDRLRGPRTPWRKSGCQLYLVPYFRSLVNSLPVSHVVVFKRKKNSLICYSVRSCSGNRSGHKKDALFRLTASVLGPQCITEQQFLLWRLLCSWTDCVCCGEYLPTFRQNILPQTYSLKMEAILASESR